MRSNAKRHRYLPALAALLVLAAPVVAQTAPADTATAYEELLIVRRLRALQLIKAQAEAIAPMLQELAKARVRADVLERAFYLETADVVSTWEIGQLRGQPLPDDVRLWLGTACTRYARSRGPEDQASYATANAVWARLSETQRTLIETDAAAKARLAKEESERRRRDASMRLALSDLSWVRNADDAQYPTERATRAEAVAKAIRPDGDAATLQMLSGRMVAFYDAVRRMSAVQYNAALPRLPQQLKYVLDPPLPKPANAPLMTGAEWVAFIQDPRTLLVLIKIMPVLPTEVAP